MTLNELTLITPVGMLGYGYSRDLFDSYLASLDSTTLSGLAIAVDAGSTDSGPQKLALNTTTCPTEAYIRDMTPLIHAAVKYNIPVLVGSAGGAGTNVAVDSLASITKDILERDFPESYIKIATIYSEVNKSLVYNKLESNQIIPCGPVPSLTTDDIDSAERIVAQMGAEPFIKALEDGANIIIGGRAYDPSMYAAWCLYHDFPEAGSWHMGKISECGGLCAEPKCRLLKSVLYRDGSFKVEPLPGENDNTSRCTPASVGAHALYEKSRPDILLGPGGALLLDEVVYETCSKTATKVYGAKFKPSDPYTVKLEGSRRTGYREIFIGGIRDPILISQIDSHLKRVEGHVKKTVKEWSDKCKLAWHVYGKNGVMGVLEPDATGQASHELGIVCEILAPTAALAHTIANTARVGCLHATYPGQIATAGSFASPIVPLEIPTGPATEWCIYHIMPIEDPVSMFPMNFIEVGTRKINGNGHASPTLQNGMNGHHPDAAPEIASGAGNKIVEELDITVPITHGKSITHYRGPDAIQGSEGTVSLGQLAKILRSKNAGPYELTFDVIFADEETYEHVQNSGVLTRERMAKAYCLEDNRITACLFYKQSLAFKFTLARPVVQSSFGETDMHGCQQSVPLMRLRIPLAL